MKKRSALARRSTAEAGRGNFVLSIVGCGIRGIICFLFKYFGQLP